MSLVYRCEVCDGDPAWQILRRGDVAVSWACAPDLSAVCGALQRDFEVTELTVVLFSKAVEWAEITRSLAAIVREEEAP